jgi:hypothetical protein
MESIMKKRLLFFISLFINIILFSEGFSSHAIVEILLRYCNPISIGVNIFSQNEREPYKINNVDNWRNYYVSKYKSMYYLKNKSILNIEWKELAKSISQINSQYFGYEVYYLSSIDNKEHYLISAQNDMILSNLEKYYGENYVYFDGVYIPAFCSKYFQNIDKGNKSLKIPLIEKANDMDFYSYIILPGKLSDPNSRKEISYQGLSDKVQSVLKEKLKTEYPIKGFWYDSFISGVLQNNGNYKWGFILDYPDEELQVKDIPYIKDTLTNWVSLRNMKSKFDMYVILDFNEITINQGLTSAVFNFLDNNPRNFWYLDCQYGTAYF